jgi:hypothetical protein
LTEVVRAGPKPTHHPRRRAIRGRGYFKRLGPGIVTGAADPGVRVYPPKLTESDGEDTLLLQRAAPYCPASAVTTGASASATSAPKTK